MKACLSILVALAALVVSGSAQCNELDGAKVFQAPAETTRSNVPRCLASEIETLTWASDLSSYMDKSCPADVRAKALRQMWQVMPLPTDPNPTEF